MKTSNPFIVRIFLVSCVVEYDVYRFPRVFLSDLAKHFAYFRRRDVLVVGNSSNLFRHKVQCAKDVVQFTPQRRSIRFCWDRAAF